MAVLANGHIQPTGIRQTAKLDMEPHWISNDLSIIACEDMGGVLTKTRHWTKSCIHGTIGRREEK